MDKTLRGIHIGYLTPEYPHARATSSAGIGSSIRNTAIALVNRGVSVSVFIFGQKKDDIFNESGIKFHLIKQRRYRMLGWFLYRKFLQNYMNKYVEADGIDLIEAADWTGITAFIKLRCPLVIRMHGSDAYFCELENRKQKRKNYFFEKRALKGADHLLSVSKFTAEKTESIFALRQTITVIPNGIDIEFFKPISGIVKPNSILYFGSIIRKKGVLELAGIFNKVVAGMPNATLTLLGKDVEDIMEKRSTYQLFNEKLSSQARKRVTYIPGVGYDEIQNYINSATVVVLPSFAEAFPMTWLESMAMEKAMVTSNIGWAPEVMVKNITGYMEYPGDHNAYAEKVLKLLNETELAMKMGKAARERVISNFSTHIIIEKNLDLYKSIIKN